MRKFWCSFFVFWPIVAILLCWVAPQYGWWFPGESVTVLGQEIDDLFYLILVIVTVVFVGTQAALGYVLWTGAHNDNEKSWFTHGSHNLEVIWSVVPSVILLFLALYQMDVWMRFRVKTFFPEGVIEAPVAEVTARQFEWRIRYPAPGKTLRLKPEPDDLYTVNDLHVPINKAVNINLRSEDVQHSFFLPHFRVKQDAIPGQVIPVWFKAEKRGEYELLCAELCGWGHYKMRARCVVEREVDFQAYLKKLQTDQNYDGFPTPSESLAKKSDE